MLQLTADTDPTSLTGEVASLIGDLKPPAALFVRLLDTNDPDYLAVETFSATSSIMGLTV